MAENFTAGIAPGSPEKKNLSERIKLLFDYTLLEGNCRRSALTLDIYNALTNSDNNIHPAQRQQHQQQMEKIAKVAASIELLQLANILVDDIIDNEAIRLHFYKISKNVF